MYIYNKYKYLSIFYQFAHNEFPVRFYIAQKIPLEITYTNTYFKSQFFSSHQSLNYRSDLLTLDYLQKVSIKVETTNQTGLVVNFFYMKKGNFILYIFRFKSMIYQTWKNVQRNI